MNPETPASPFPALALRSLSVGPMDNNAYLLTCRATGAQLLIDAAAEPERLLALVAEGAADGPAGAAGASPDGADGGEAGSAPAKPARLERIVTTHRHHDHIGALAAVVAATGARTAAGAEDAESIREQTGVTIDEPLRHGDRLTVGTVELEVIALRGHTPGSIALLWRGGEDGDHLFTGDSLFPGGVGNTQQDPELFAQLLGDVEERVFAVLPDATAVHPGHGAPTTLGAERPELPAWRARGW